MHPWLHKANATAKACAIMDARIDCEASATVAARINFEASATVAARIYLMLVRPCYANLLWSQCNMAAQFGIGFQSPVAFGWRFD